MGLDILGIDILRVDIFGVAIPAPTFCSIACVSGCIYLTKFAVNSSYHAGESKFFVYNGFRRSMNDL